MIRIAYQQQLKDFELQVDFEIPTQGISVLFGPSGAGKSSLLNLLAGLHRAGEKSAQRFFKLNHRIYDDSLNKICLKPWQRKIAYVFQDHRLFPHLNVENNILYGFKRRKSRLRAESVIEKSGLTELLEHYPQQLSGGQKQRVAMARAILSAPELLILDEPLAALDYASKHELLPFIECIRDEWHIPIIYVSHDIREVLRLADYVVIMDRGRIVDRGELAELCLHQPLLTRQEGASFILQGQVDKIHQADALAEINCEGINIVLAGKNLQPEQTVRILIHARDVSLCLTPSKDSSILNCVPIRIENLKEETEGSLRVEAEMGRQTLLAIISKRSARKLEVEKGRRMYAQFKATAMIK